MPQCVLPVSTVAIPLVTTGTDIGLPLRNLNHTRSGLGFLPAPFLPWLMMPSVQKVPEAPSSPIRFASPVACRSRRYCPTAIKIVPCPAISIVVVITAALTLERKKCQMFVRMQTPASVDRAVERNLRFQEGKGGRGKKVVKGGAVSLEDSTAAVVDRLAGRRRRSW